MTDLGTYDYVQRMVSYGTMVGRPTIQNDKHGPSLVHYVDDGDLVYVLKVAYKNREPQFPVLVTSALHRRWWLRNERRFR